MERPLSAEAPRFRATPWVLVVLAAAPVATDCTSDHSALAARPHPAAGAAGQAGGGTAGAGGRPPGTGANGGTGGTALPPDKHMETPGRSVFTVVHGVVDAARVVWCFARVRDGRTELVGEPVPEGGLGYGESLSFEKLSHIDSESDGVVPYLITGDLSLVEGLDCADAVVRAGGPDLFPTLGPAVPLASAGEGGQGGSGGESGSAQGGEGGLGGVGAEGGTGARGGSGAASGAAGDGNAAAGGVPATASPLLRVGALPGLPAGTLAQGFSVLEVADGCFGAPDFKHGHQREICGADYTPSEGSLTAELVILGRATAAGYLALQALHASRGSANLGVRSAPPRDAIDSWVTLVDNFNEGALRPTDPRRNLSSEDWGTTSGMWTIDATVNTVPTFSERWPVVKKRAGIAKLEDGRGYTIIVLGPSAEVEGEGWWNPPAFGLVDNDPGGD